jgi:hypothetical protein
MKSLKCLTVIVLLLSGKFAFGQDQNIWMYGWRPAATQELYDSYMDQLYVKTPYLQEHYERDIYQLYAGLKDYEKISQYCDGKMTDSLKLGYVVNIRVGYQAWGKENKGYIDLIVSLWNKLIGTMSNDKKREWIEKVESQNKSRIEHLRYNGSVDESCRKVALDFAYEDQAKNIIGIKSEQERFSDAYRNVDFFLHPEKKEEFKKELKRQLDVGLAGEKACKKLGGTWQAVGMRQSMACITKYPDAGKSCTDNSQCKGGCLDVTPHDHVGDRIGKCKTDNDHFGCTSYLTQGKRDGPVLCID